MTAGARLAGDDRPQWEHAFVCLPPFPVAGDRLDSAPGRDLARVRAVARELPTVVTLADAVRVLLLVHIGLTRCLGAQLRTGYMSERMRSDPRTSGQAEVSAIDAASPALLLAHANAVRMESAALQAEGRQARRQARAVRDASTAILEAARKIADDVLRARGFALAAPVTARFRQAESGTTGRRRTERPA